MSGGEKLNEVCRLDSENDQSHQTLVVEVFCGQSRLTEDATLAVWGCPFCLLTRVFYTSKTGPSGSSGQTHSAC